MVNHLAIQLLRHVVIKRTVACLHVIDGSVHSFCDNRCNGGACVAWVLVNNQSPVASRQSPVASRQSSVVFPAHDKSRVDSKFDSVLEVGGPFGKIVIRCPQT